MMKSDQDIEQLSKVFRDNENTPKQDFWYYFYCLCCQK